MGFAVRAFYYWRRISRVALPIDSEGDSGLFRGRQRRVPPMHLTGLMGMPRRVYTYPAVMQWEVLNMISTIGAFLFAAGVAIFLIDLIRNLRPAVSKPAGNIWGAATLEWLPNDVYGPRSIPAVTSAYPLWDHPQLAREVQDGRHFLPGSITGLRETIVTSPVDAMPQYLLRLPGPGWTPLLAAVLTAAFFMLLTVKAVVLALICGLLGLLCGRVEWVSDLKPLPTFDIGANLKLPYATGGVACLVGHDVCYCRRGAYLSYVFSYLFLWTVSRSVADAFSVARSHTLSHRLLLVFALQSRNRDVFCRKVSRSGAFGDCRARPAALPARW